MNIGAQVIRYQQI